MTNLIASLPVDPTGVATANYITTEYQQITGGSQAVIRPDWGAFFKDSFQIYGVDGSNGLKLLTFGTDYILVELDTAASESTGKVIYQAVLILNTELTSTFSLTYQAYGGLYNQNKALIYTNANIYAYGAAIDYSTLLGLPATYPPVAHTHDIADVYGFEWINNAVNTIQLSLIGALAGNSNQAIQYKLANFVTATSSNTENLAAAISTHIANNGYSHSYTAAMVGLGNVSNYGFINLGGGIPYYASPSTVAYYTNNANWPVVSTAIIAAHKANSSNPHSDSAISIGLTNVLNYAIQVNYTTNQYLTMFANGATSTYLGPYAVTRAVTDYALSQYAIIYTTPAAAISNGSTGLLDTATSIEATASSIVASTNTTIAGISTNEASIISNANTAAALVKRYAVVSANLEYASMLTQISQYDYARRAVNASVSTDGYWPVPSNVDGLYLWLSSNNPNNTLFQDPTGNLRVTKLVDKSTYAREYSAVANNAPIYKASSDVSNGGVGIMTGYVMSFSNGQGLVQSHGPIARLRPGMSVFAIYKTPSSPNVFTLLSSQSTTNGINVYGNATNSVVSIKSTNWNALTAAPSTVTANASTIFGAVISAADETSSWCVANADTSNVTYPRGVNTPVVTWPGNTYVGDALDIVGNNNYGVANVGELAELIVYNRALSGAEATAVLEYLRLRYNHSTALTIDYSALNAF